MRKSARPLHRLSALEPTMADSYGGEPMIQSPHESRDRGQHELRWVCWVYSVQPGIYFGAKLRMLEIKKGLCQEALGWLRGVVPNILGKTRRVGRTPLDLGLAS